MINRRELVIALGAVALAAPLGSLAQQGKVWGIGYLTDAAHQMNPIGESTRSRRKYENSVTSKEKTW